METLGQGKPVSWVAMIVIVLIWISLAVLIVTFIARTF